MLMFSGTDTFTNILSYGSGYFVIFLLAALAGMYSERSGVVNLGIEGYMTIGGLSFAIYGSFMSDFGEWIQIITMVLAILTVALFSLIHVFAVIKLKCDQIISGTAINLLAQGLGLFIVYSELFGNGVFIRTGFSPLGLDDKKIMSLYFIISMIIITVLGCYFMFTKTGNRHISAGENPNALDAAGINVIKYRVIALIISAMIAGLAGTFYVMNRGSGSFYGSTNGYGFLGLAIMIAGQWRVSYITLFAAIFGIMFSLSDVLPTMFSWIPKGKWVNALPFVLSLVAMIIFSKWSKAPKASGQVFDKSKR